MSRKLSYTEWRSQISPAKYERDSAICEMARRESLELIRQQLTAKEDEGLPEPKSNVSTRALQVYENWKRQDPSKDKCIEVSGLDFLVLTCLLENARSDKSQKNECHKMEFDAFWDCPYVIQNILRDCVLQRDWDTITHLCLILLHYSKKYLPIVKNMCRLMLIYNPKIKQYGMVEQFHALIKGTNNDSFQQSEEIELDL